VWGLAFKPQTDDVRESPALALIHELLGAGAHVVVHDPVAMAATRDRLEERAADAVDARVTFARTSYEAVAGADALVIVTDWNEYRNPNFRRMRDALARPILVDGRNLYDPRQMALLGFRYYSIGRPTSAAAVAS
jgi:UDPglucose 6-dehydrogenase